MRAVPTGATGTSSSWPAGAPGKLTAISGISTIPLIPKQAGVAGSGYNMLSDIVLRADGTHTSIAERSRVGNQLRVPLSSLNRSAAAVVAGNPGDPGSQDAQ